MGLTHRSATIVTEQFGFLIITARVGYISNQHCLVVQGQDNKLVCSSRNHCQHHENPNICIRFLPLPKHHNRIPRLPVELSWTLTTLHQPTMARRSALGMTGGQSGHAAKATHFPHFSRLNLCGCLLDQNGVLRVRPVDTFASCRDCRLIGKTSLSAPATTVMADGPGRV